MALTTERINELAGRTGVRKEAVNNFLRSLYDTAREDALANLDMDARLYKWNAATVNAIRTGINEHCARK